MYIKTGQYGMGDLKGKIPRDQKWCGERVNEILVTAYSPMLLMLS